MNEYGTTSPHTTESESEPTGADAFGTARGIARGVVGGAILWAFVLVVGFV